ncbi:hypothetical protein SAMN02745174_02552 [Cetobacterium ceti]|uniref:Uncharacterized protein n=1 Tax=Cetobacterium ceti TaxID=180163 RepID=A0A1T4R306_9FUSO|nr:hypothetical protein [Cetobacterium ceti]SKA09998.1 hypothetical protein SAMN02745174_02552 [Cetobacterium ceti]
MSVMDKIKARTAELKNKNKENYESIIDYDKCGIIEMDIREKLIDCEKKVVYHANEITKNTMELSKVFYEAQSLLANHNGGTFRIWFESLGFKKDFVYMCLKRNNLFLELKEDKVFLIPDRAIKSLTKIKNKIQQDRILEIIKSDNPLELAKKEEALSVRPTTENDILNIEVIENEKDEIEKIKNQIYIKEQELKELKKILKEKMDKYENRGNLTIDDLSI